MADGRKHTGSLGWHRDSVLIKKVGFGEVSRGQGMMLGKTRFLSEVEGAWMDPRAAVCPFGDLEVVTPPVLHQSNAHCSLVQQGGSKETLGCSILNGLSCNWFGVEAARRKKAAVGCDVNCGFPSNRGSEVLETFPSPASVMLADAGNELILVKQRN